MGQENISRIEIGTENEPAVPYAEFVMAFRKTGRCPTCGAQTGIPCPKCQTFLFPAENYCPSCGASVAQKKKSKCSDEREWTSDEAELLAESVRSAAESKTSSAPKQVLDQVGIDDIFRD